MNERAEHSTSQLAVALGAALLALAVAVTQVRMDDDWAGGVHLAVALAAAAALLAAGLAAPRLPDRLAGGTSALLLAGLALWAIADFRLVELLFDDGEDPFGDSGAGPTLFFVLAAVVALAVAARSGSAACLLFAAVAAGGAVVAGVFWIFDTSDTASYRPVFVGLAVAFAAAAYALRRRPRHRDVMVDAAGLALVGLSQVSDGFSLFFFFGVSDTPSAWAAVLLAGGLALLAYSAVTRAPGPVVLALLVLLSFGSGILSDDSEETGAAEGLNLVGWPLVLLGLSLAAFVFGILSRGHDPDRAVH